MTPLGFMLTLYLIAVGLLDALLLASQLSEDRIGPLMFPLFAAQASLLGLWLVLGKTRFWLRLIGTLGGLALLSYLQASSSAHDWNEWLWVFSITTLCTLLSQVVWQTCGAQALPWLTSTHNAPLVRPTHFARQFGLRDVFLAMTGLAMLFGFARWLGPPSFELLEILGMAVSFGVLASTVFLPIVLVRRIWIGLSIALLAIILAALALVATRFGLHALRREWLVGSGFLLASINASVVIFAALAWRYGRESTTASTAPAVPPILPQSPVAAP